jgi:hypothetical protein
MKILVFGPQGTSSHQLGAEKVSIGRGAECTITLPGRHLSRCHCEIVPIEDWYEIVDGCSGISSLNGLWLAGNRIKRHRLVVGERIALGSGYSLEMSDLDEETLSTNTAIALWARERIGEAKPALVLIEEADGWAICFLSDAATSLLGFTEEELLGNSPFKVFPHMAPSFWDEFMRSGHAHHQAAALKKSGDEYSIADIALQLESQMVQRVPCITVLLREVRHGEEQIEDIQNPMLRDWAHSLLFLSMNWLPLVRLIPIALAFGTAALTALQLWEVLQDMPRPTRQQQQQQRSR